MIPNYAFDENDYYMRLHEQTILYSEGEFDALDELSSENVNKLKKKNKILIPIYQQVISYVKFIKNTNEKKLYDDYQVSIQLVNKDFNNASKEEKQK